MKKLIIIVSLISIGIISSCDNPKKKLIKLDYSNSKVIDSLIKNIPQSVDTLFLGFTTDMNKSEYKKHIYKLRNEGKTIKYSSSFIWESLLGKTNLGAGYLFETTISIERTPTKIITGYGKYFLEPTYTKKNKNLAKLSILRSEIWDNEAKGNWIEHNIYKNSKRFSDSDLKKALKKYEIISDGDFIRQKGNLIIYGDNLHVTYINKRTLLYNLLIKVRVKEMIIEKEKNKDIKF
jgi:hypothetical protein